jgi:hypothetical protein
MQTLYSRRKPIVKARFANSQTIAVTGSPNRRSSRPDTRWILGSKFPGIGCRFPLIFLRRTEGSVEVLQPKIAGSDRGAAVPAPRFLVVRQCARFPNNYSSKARKSGYSLLGMTRGAGAVPREVDRATTYFICARRTSTAFSICRSWPPRKSGGVLST